MRLAVLAHHDHRRLERGERREHAVLADERIRTEGALQNDVAVDRHPDDENPAEDQDEPPAPAELRHFIGDALAERHLRLEILMHELTDAPAPRDLRDHRVLDLRQLLILGLEVSDELLGAVLLETARADPETQE